MLLYSSCHLQRVWLQSWHRDRSVTYNKERSGQRMEPCGTPLVTGSQWDIPLRTTTSAICQPKRILSYLTLSLWFPAVWVCIWVICEALYQTPWKIQVDYISLLVIVIQVHPVWQTFHISWVTQDHPVWKQCCSHDVLSLSLVWIQRASNTRRSMCFITWLVRETAIVVAIHVWVLLM